MTLLSNLVAERRRTEALVELWWEEGGCRPGRAPTDCERTSWLEDAVTASPPQARLEHSIYKWRKTIRTRSRFAGLTDGVRVEETEPEKVKAEGNL